MANKRLEYGTTIDENSMYLVQYEFKNGFRDIKLNNLKYMKGSDVVKLFNKGIKSLKASKLVDGENIGIMHTYEVADKFGMPRYDDGGVYFKIATLLGKSKESDFVPRVCSSTRFRGFYETIATFEKAMTNEDRIELRKHIDEFPEDQRALIMRLTTVD